MKMAKVSPVYEGKLGKRGQEGFAEEEELGRSRKARIDAKARRENSRMNCRAVLFPGKKIMTDWSSMNSTSLEKEMEIQKEYPDIYVGEEKNNENEEKWTLLEVINMEDEENDITQEVINIVEVEKEQKLETAMAAVLAAPSAEKEEKGWFLGCEEWPTIWTYEEEWLWWRQAPLGLGLGSNSNNPHWEYISGVGWIQMKGE